MNQPTRRTGKPIIYIDVIKTRFNDLDPYGHVNASVYLDYIISSRWNYLEKTIGVNSAELIKQGVGFFLVNSNITYRKPIKGSTEVTVKSWVSSIEGPLLFVDFAIEGQNGTVFSNGVLQFVVMNLKTGQKQECPKEVEYLLWEKGDG
ncbi:MAG: acyl-CoA thioesterase [Deltaproteobacteria bacterium]|nr:acyl-CoA thioesterase [Deltaproteobacteria bacterium]